MYSYYIVYMHILDIFPPASAFLPSPIPPKAKTIFIVVVCGGVRHARIQRFAYGCRFVTLFEPLVLYL